MKRPRSAPLIALFCLGWMLLSFPLLTLWDLEARLFGLPLFPLGLFIVWAGLIVALAVLMERRQ